MRVWLTDAWTAIQMREWRYVLPGWLFRMIYPEADACKKPANKPNR